MPTNDARLGTENSLPHVLREAIRALDGVPGELTLDFRSVGRIETGSLQALEELAGKADEKRVRVVLAGVPVGVYRALKLAKLSSRFSFL